MSRRPARFTQAELARVFKAMAQTDTDMAVELTPEGNIRIARSSGLPTPPIESVENRPRRVP